MTNNRIPPLLSNCLALFAIYYFLMPQPALAYFDLGTGTYMLQMVLAFGAAIWLSLRTSWIRIGRKKKPSGADNLAQPVTIPGESDQAETTKAE